MSILTDNSEIGVLLQSVCTFCDETRDCYRDSYDGETKAVCEDCQGFFEWCEVCKTSHCTEWSDPCRHLYWHELGWLGSGACRWNWQHSKPGFLALMALIGREHAATLREALSARRYWFQLYGSIFGWSELNAELGISDDLDTRFRFGNVFAPLFEDCDEDEEAADGLNWLLSLWCGEPKTWGEEPGTLEAELETIKWIDEWLADSGVEA